jgi:hypothetical protein
MVAWLNDVIPHQPTFTFAPTLLSCLVLRSPDEIAVCNLASIALPRFVREQGSQPGWDSKKLVGSLDAPNRFFDFEKLTEMTKVGVGARRAMCVRGVARTRGPLWPQVEGVACTCRILATCLNMK